MEGPTDKSTEGPTKNFTQTWRYKAGISLLVIGHSGMLAGLLVPVLGLVPGSKAGAMGALILGGEIVSLSSIVFLGKAGFMAIKKKLFSFVREGYVAHIGPVRHYIGIALFLTCMLTTYTTALYAWIAFRTATPEDPMPVIWGLQFGGNAFAISSSGKTQTLNSMPKSGELPMVNESVRRISAINHR